MPGDHALRLLYPCRSQELYRERLRDQLQEDRGKGCRESPEDSWRAGRSWPSLYSELAAKVCRCQCPPAEIMFEEEAVNHGSPEMEDKNRGTVVRLCGGIFGAYDHGDY